MSIFHKQFLILRTFPEVIFVFVANFFVFLQNSFIQRRFLYYDTKPPPRYPRHVKPM